MATWTRRIVCFCLLLLSHRINGEIVPNEYKPIGLENGEIPNDMIITPEENIHPGYEGCKGRLNNRLAWCLSPSNSILQDGDVITTNTYMQISFLKPTTIDAVRLQGYRKYRYGRYIYITYDFSNGIFNHYKINDTKKIVVGNKKGNDSEIVYLNPPIRTKHIRIYLQQGPNPKCLRAEMYTKHFVIGEVEDKTIDSAEGTGDDVEFLKQKVLLIALVCTGVLIIIIVACILVQWYKKCQKNQLDVKQRKNKSFVDNVNTSLNDTPSASSSTVIATKGTSAATITTTTTTTNIPQQHPERQKSETNTSKKRFSSHIYASISSFIRQWSRTSSRRKAQKSRTSEHQYANSYMNPMDAIAGKSLCFTSKQESYIDMNAAEGQTEYDFQELGCLHEQQQEEQEEEDKMKEEKMNEDVFYMETEENKYQSLCRIDPSSVEYESLKQDVYVELL